MNLADTMPEPERTEEPAHSGPQPAPAPKSEVPDPAPAPKSEVPPTTAAAPEPTPEPAPEPAPELTPEHGTDSDSDFDSAGPDLFRPIKEAIMDATRPDANRWAARMADHSIKGFSYQGAVQVLLIFTDMNNKDIKEARYVAEGSEDIDVVRDYEDGKEELVLYQVKHVAEPLNMEFTGTLFAELAKPLQLQPLSFARNRGFGRPRSRWVLWTTQPVLKKLQRRKTRSPIELPQRLLEWFMTDCRSGVESPITADDVTSFWNEKIRLLEEKKRECAAHHTCATHTEPSDKKEIEETKSKHEAASKRLTKAKAYVDKLPDDASAIVAAHVFVKAQACPDGGDHTADIIKRAVAEVKRFAASSETFSQLTDEQQDGVALAVYQDLFSKIMTAFDAARGTSMAVRAERRVVKLSKVRATIMCGIAEEDYTWSKVKERVQALRSTLDALENPRLEVWYKKTIEAFGHVWNNPVRFTAKRARELESQLSPIFGRAYGLAKGSTPARRKRQRVR